MQTQTQAQGRAKEGQTGETLAARPSWVLVQDAVPYPGVVDWIAGDLGDPADQERS